MYTGNFSSRMNCHISIQKHFWIKPVKELSLLSPYVKFHELRPLTRTITLSSKKCTKLHFVLTKYITKSVSK